MDSAGSSQGSSQHVRNSNSYLLIKLTVVVVVLVVVVVVVVVDVTAVDVAAVVHVVAGEAATNC